MNVNKIYIIFSQMFTHQKKEGNERTQSWQDIFEDPRIMVYHLGDRGITELASNCPTELYGI